MTHPCYLSLHRALESIEDTDTDLRFDPDALLDALALDLLPLTEETDDAPLYV